MATQGSTALSLFPRRVRFVEKDGFLTPEAIRALQALFFRVGGASGDQGTDVFQPAASSDDEELSALFSGFLQDEPALEPLPSQPAAIEADPIGTVRIFTVATDPAILLGYGTWQLIEERFLVGYKAGDPDFGTLGGTGGARTVTVATHDNHTHDVTSNVTDSTGNFTAGAVPAVTGITNNTVTSTIEDPALTHDPASILPPYRVVCMWERIA